MNGRSGAHFLSMLNDLKRRPEDAAAELGIAVEDVYAIIRGEKEITGALVEKARKVWPVNARDFYLVQDDAPSGVKIMRAEESEKTKRIMDRGGKAYYEYRDTAMTTITSFRPEWIAPLCIVSDNSPENRDIQWNNGHLMHQFTYFIGPVNFYHEGKNEKKHVAVMNTGDSMYITPFVPHSFATRKNDAEKYGLILALTYGEKLGGDTQQELSALGQELAIQFPLDFPTREKGFASLLRFYTEAASMTLEELGERSRMERRRLEGYMRGEHIPDDQQLGDLAAALGVSTRDLLPPDVLEDKVMVKYYRDAKRWVAPETTRAYELVELASTRFLPNSRALEMHVKKEQNAVLDLRVGLHQYGYNIGEQSVTLKWRMNKSEYAATVHSGDSFYMKPYVEHAFRGEGKLLLLRIGGRIVGEAQRELSRLTKEGVGRVIAEQMRWYNPEGKQ